MCRFKELGKMKETKFELYELKPFIIDAVHRLGFYEPTDIQKRLIPAVLKKKASSASLRRVLERLTPIYCLY